MNRTRIIEILETYRPGEGLESDPEIREALELASRDPELAAIREEATAFDEAFREKFRDIEVPDNLFEDILESAEKHRAAKRFSGEKPRNIITGWFHPAAFAAAAAIILLLALSFTFRDSPAPSPLAERTMTAGVNPVLQLASSLYENKKPSFKSSNHDEILGFVHQRGGLVPASFPEGFAWDRTFACDVIDVDGVKISMICFLGPDMKNAMHLFTFRKADFPGVNIPPKPSVQEIEDYGCASWANQEEIMVLFSDAGPENLRSVLDI